MSSKIELPTQTLSELFEYARKNYSENIALTKVDEEGMSYEQLGKNVEDLQVILKSLGIKKGDKVALLSENMPNWGVVYFAVTLIGAVIVPILPDFHENEVHHIIRHSESKAIFVSKRHNEKVTIENNSLSYVFEVDSLNIVDELSSNVQKFFQKQKESLLDLKNRIISMTSGVDTVAEKELILENDLAAIIYTSGTTGQSKGVMLTHLSLTFEAIVSQGMTPIGTQDRFLSILPLAHTYECTVGFLVPLLGGSSIHYIDKVPTPRVLVAAMASVKPSYILSVPLVIEKIYKSKIQPNFSKNIVISTLYKVPFIRKKLHEIAGKKLLETFGGNLKFFGVGGAPLSAHVESFLREAKFPYAIGYGLTECAPMIAGCKPSLTKYRSTGPAVKGVELKIVKENEKDRDGEVYARGPNIMLGYYKDEARTKMCIDEEGWFNTEDLGYFDDDGYLFLQGRSKNVIIGAGGENIYPELVEAIINENELVLDSLVYEREGKVVARIHMDYDKLDEIYDVKKSAESEIKLQIEDHLEKMRLEANSKLSSFSRVMKFIEQSEPFVKTPTKKIKRFLYIDK
jgi:long-chain acyl-CoA synthetase